MQLIKNNPYRIVGLLVGATAKEENKQIKKLKMYLDADQEPKNDYSFPALGNFKRTLADVNEAASKLNLDADKMNAALFWFYKGYEITDEPAFDHLNDSNVQQASLIWKKLLSNGEISQRNSSAYHNLSTLLLYNTFNNSSINLELLEEAIELKLKFLESDYSIELKTRATDSTYRTTKKQLQLLFLNQLQSEIGTNGGVTSFEFIRIINKFDFLAKEDFLKGFVQKPIDQIEKKIVDTRSGRKTNKGNSVNIGIALYDDTANMLSLLRSILGATNIQYTSISAKVSDEVLQCGIEYFSHYRDSNINPGPKAMDLFQKAKTLAIGNITKQRCKENTENLQRWIDDKPERDKQKKIEVDLQFITNKLERFQNLSDTVANARDLIDSCKPRINNIKVALRSTDKLYLQISSAIVNNAQGMLVALVNRTQEGFKNSQVFNQFGTTASQSFGRSFGNLNVVSLDDLSITVNNSFAVTTSMQSMDMDSKTRTQFNRNREAISSIRNQINSAKQAIRSAERSNNSGCYIATMAYGDYDHRQVMILRQFRDDVLDKSYLGKWFIKTYYRYSPTLVEKLKTRVTINKIIRNTLNQLIKLIK